MIKYFLFTCLYLLPVSLMTTGQKPDLTGKAISIMDGDTFKLLTTDNQQVKIRLNGIDAPEKGQDYSKNSKDFLAKRLQAAPIRVVAKGKDKYGRIIGDVYTGNGQLVNLELVKAGLAWHFLKYSHDPQLAAAELEARQHKTGLWQQPEPIAPWDYRKRKRK
jgi:micrococcal nuclease